MGCLFVRLEPPCRLAGDPPPVGADPPRGVRDMAVTQAGKVGAIRVAAPMRSRTLWADAWLRLRRNKVAVASVIVLLLLALIAIFAPRIDPEAYLTTVRDPVTHST